MAFASIMNIVGSGLTAEQLRLDVISENITNMNTTRTEGGGPYRRKVVRFEAEADRDGFRRALAAAMDASNRGAEKAGGVRVTDILEDPSDLPVTFDPDHPDANEGGDTGLFRKCYRVQYPENGASARPGDWPLIKTGQESIREVKPRYEQYF